VARCSAGRRGQHEDIWKILLRRLPAQDNRLGRPSIKKTRRLLASEGDGLGPKVTHLFPERGNLDGEGEGLMVHARAELADIGEADAEAQECGKFIRLVIGAA
jgi:hypothetical protein